MEKKWTFMVYLDADNNLEPFGIDDLDEMKGVGSGPNINIIVLWDGRGSGDGELYYITQGGADVFPTSDAGIPEEPDMADSDTLDDFLQWGITNFPAEHYLLSIWDHGSGIFRGEDDGTKGFCNDEHGGGEIELWELNDVLANANASAGKKIDIVGFDVCILGHIETHFQIAPYVDFGIASQANEPGDGWDYYTPLNALANNPNMPAEDFAAEIVTAYVDQYNSGTITQAAVDLGRLKSHFIPLFENFTTYLTNYQYYYENDIQAVRNGAASFSGSNHRDLYDFVEGIQQSGSLPSSLRNSAGNLMAEFQNIVIEEGHLNANGAHGMEIYFPTSGPSSTYINNIDMSNTGWDEYLKEYESPSEHFDMKIDVFDEDEDGHDDDVMITVQNVLGTPVSNGQVWIDAASIGTTNEEGIIYYYNSSKGYHQVRVNTGIMDIYGDFDVLNRPPIAMATIPDATPAGESVGFNGSLSWDPDGDALSFLWNFGDGGGSSLKNPTHVFMDDGEFEVSLIVIDTDAVESSPFTFNVGIENLAPLANAGGNITALEDEIITFDGSASWDTTADREIMQFRWNFGDGTETGWSNNSAVNHSYTNQLVSGTSETYDVILSVRDDDGIIAKDQIYVTITNIPPTADAGVDLTCFEDETVLFDGGNSIDSLSDMPHLTYEWDFLGSDGLNYSDGEGMEVYHTYHFKGVYDVRLRVTDDNDITSTDNIQVKVLNVEPVALLNTLSYNIQEGENLILNASASFDSYSDIDTLQYTWDIDNIIASEDKIIQINFTGSGIYNGSLSVMDDDGAIDTVEFNITVINVAPMASLKANLSTVDEDMPIELNASESSDTRNDMGTLEYRWDLDYIKDTDFSPDKVTNHPILIHSFPTAGVKCVKLMVVDDDGLTSTHEIFVTVNNVRPNAMIMVSKNPGIIGEQFIFDGRNSTDTNSDIGTLKYIWYIDDVEIEKDNHTLKYVFEKPGEYRIKLEIYDDDGAMGVTYDIVNVEELKDKGITSIRYISIPIIIIFVLVLVTTIVVKKKRKGEIDTGGKAVESEIPKPEIETEQTKKEYERLYGNRSDKENKGEIKKLVPDESIESNFESNFLDENNEFEYYEYKKSEEDFFGEEEVLIAFDEPDESEFEESNDPEYDEEIDLEYNGKNNLELLFDEWDI